ncbi:MAG: type IV toxin-antitoxin system AbiEi family antitoxin [Sediminibacterium sp.]|jgi:hypothetical protein
MREKIILTKALNQFTKLTGIGVKILGNQFQNTNIVQHNAYIELKTANQTIKLFVEVKNEIREQNLPQLLSVMKKGEGLLVCNYIPKTLKETLKLQGINYLETAGNCFIRKDGILLYINDKEVTKVRQTKDGKLWKTTGIKFLFGILNNPLLINATYRNMAEITGVALGSIGPFLEELKKEGFLKETVADGKTILILENMDALIFKWAGLYNVILKPKLIQGRFKFTEKQMAKEWEKITVTDFYWGGETAGALLTKHLHPEILTIYTNQPKVKLMQQLRIIPDTEGNIEMIDQFWNNQTNEQHKTVPPLLAYADLVTSLDSRNRETAERIKKHYLETTH